MNNDDIHVSDKHVPLRVALFILALAVAAGAFSLAVTSIGRKTEGFQRVEGDADPEALYYQSGVELMYYFTGSSAEIKTGINTLRGVYGPALQRAYKLLDCREEYEGYTNLAALNAARGQRLEVPEELFTVLADAYEKTCRQEGYSLFAGALYAQWESILTLTEPWDFDPLEDDQQAAVLSRLAEETLDLSHFTLELDEEKHTVRFDVDNDYLALLTELEIEAPVLDLNLLHDAYELSLVRDALVSQGWETGYLTSDSGITVSLPGHRVGEYCFYGCAEGEALPAARLPVVPGSAASQFRVFAFTAGEAEYYTVDGERNTVYRHPYLTAAGEHTGVLMSAFALAEDGDPAEACFETIRLFAQPDAAGVRTLAGHSRLPLAWTMQGEEKRLHTNAPDRFVPAEDHGWTLD